MELVSVTALRKSFRRGFSSVPALDGLDLVVPEGGVHGFLGPNGSGKTTTLRILLGQVRPDSGDVRILGRRIPEELPQVVGEVGSLIESPRLFPQWGGRYNLEVLARIGGASPRRIEECLELVGMRDRADLPFERCSLGMKQRLGIAAALLKSPRLLILDEPANGLDPAGIREMRELIARLSSDGRTTILVSSHQLHEVELVCDRVSVVSGGRLVADGAVGALLNSERPPDVLVRVRGSLAAAQRALDAEGVASELRADGLLVRTFADPATLTEILAARGQFVSALIPQETSLESAFLDWTSHDDAVAVGR